MSQAKVVIIQNFLSAQECAELNAWTDAGIASNWLSFGIDTSKGDKSYAGRLTTRGYEDRFEFPALAHQISARITDRLGLSTYSKSDNGNEFGIVNAVMVPGSHTIKHLDPKEDNGVCHVYRCNVVTRAAEQGGELVIGGNTIALNPGDLHCYPVTLYPHAVTEVGGNTSRVLWMFGYQIPEEELDAFIERVQ